LTRAVSITLSWSIKPIINTVKRLLNDEKIPYVLRSYVAVPFVGVEA